jgi:hypothetical protein
VVFLPLHLVHRFGFSTVIRGSESKKVVTLGSLDPRRLSGLCGILVVFLGTPIKLWRFFKGKAFVAIYWEPPIKLWR